MFSFSQKFPHKKLQVNAITADDLKKRLDFRPILWYHTHKGIAHAYQVCAKWVYIMKKKTKLLLLRVLLGVLILANMIVIFLFSAQNGEESGKTSGEVTKVVAEVTVKDFAQKPAQEQTKIIEKMHPILRKLAHMTEFGSLGALIFLLLLTWKGSVWWRFGASLAGTFLYACTDELHQLLAEDRGPQFIDVLIDTSGALITCSVLLAVVLLIKHKKGKKSSHMQTTHYEIKSTVKAKIIRNFI